METECSQEPGTGPCTEPYECSPLIYVTFCKASLIRYCSPIYFMQLPGGSFRSGFPSELFCTNGTATMRATCPARILRDLIMLVIFGEEHKKFRII